jgi:ribonuclease HII
LTGCDRNLVALTSTQPSLTALARQLFVEGKPLEPSVLKVLHADPRQAAQALVRRIERAKAATRKEKTRLQRLLQFEQALWSSGQTLVAGVDEAGMGPLAGPGFAAAVVLPVGFTLAGLDDSKKITDENERLALAKSIRERAVAFSVSFVSSQEIDAINIYQAGLLAMRRAVEGLAVVPQALLVDARTIPGVVMPQTGIVKGDAKSLSIAAASMLAKTERDAHMHALHRAFPQYGFDRHKGYPTPAHVAAIAKHGVLSFHRRSFAPVREALNRLGPRQRSLF